MTSRRRSGWSLVLAGAAAAVFFWLTDPRLSPLSRSSGGVDSLGVSHLIDRAHEAFPGTVVGLAGSAAILLIGVVLLLRRPG